MKDKLNELLRIQALFQEKYGYDPRVHECVTAVMAEAGETWAIAGGKWWKDYFKDGKPHGKLNRADADTYIKALQEKNKVEIRGELIDMLHFLLCAFIEMKMTPNDVFDEYCVKMGVNKQRQETGY